MRNRAQAVYSCFGLPGSDWSLRFYFILLFPIFFFSPWLRFIPAGIWSGSTIRAILAPDLRSWRPMDAVAGHWQRPTWSRSLSSLCNERQERETVKEGGRKSRGENTLRGKCPVTGNGGGLSTPKQIYARVLTYPINKCPKDENDDAVVMLVKYKPPRDFGDLWKQAKIFISLMLDTSHCLMSFYGRYGFILGLDNSFLKKLILWFILSFLSFFELFSDLFFVFSTPIKLI